MDDEQRRRVPVTRWVARIWSLVPIAWGLAEIMFPHAEVGVTVTWEEWATLALLGISVIGLALAWRWERLGGWISLTTLAVFLVIFLFSVERNFPGWLIFLFGIGTPATLFLVSAHGTRPHARE